MSKPKVGILLDREMYQRVFTRKEIVRLKNFAEVQFQAISATHHMINKRNLSLMKNNALLINTVRGSLIDEKATNCRSVKFTGQLQNISSNIQQKLLRLKLPEKKLNGEN